MLRSQLEVVNFNLIPLMGDLLDVVLELFSLVQRQEKYLGPRQLLPQTLILLNQPAGIILILLSLHLQRAYLLVFLDDLSL